MLARVLKRLRDLLAFRAAEGAAEEGKIVLEENEFALSATGVLNAADETRYRCSVTITHTLGHFWI